MSYYQTLGLAREPFANSPDPDLLYRSKTHLECLQHMEIAVRLRRGLNVVLGDVGTGKTTLCRELMRLLGEDPDLEIYLLDDPYFPSTEDFLLALGRLFDLDVDDMQGDQGRLKDTIKAALLQKSADGRRIVTLLVDEGQKITGDCLELLRELLNFETNTHKLLQIVIFAQKEFDEVLVARPNLDDRVNYRYELRPLDRYHTSRLIRARLNLCASGGKAPMLFSRLALRRIHRLTGGYPRKIVRLCHMSMLLCVGLGRRHVSWRLVGRAAREVRSASSGWRLSWSTTAAGLGLAALVGLAGLGVRSMLVEGPVAFWPALHATASGSAVPSVVAAHGFQPVTASAHGARSHALSFASSHAADRPAGALPSAHAAAKPAVSLPATATAPAAAPSTPTVAPNRDLAATPAPVRPASGDTPTPPKAKTLAETQKSIPPAAPDTLGRAVTRRGWTVSQQAVWLYGTARRALISQLAEANPGVDMQCIRVGQSLVFPAIAAAALRPGERLLKVADVADLEKGFLFLARHRRGSVPLTLFATFQPGAGLRFEVVLPDVFADEAAAKAELAALPAALAAKAAVVSGYPEGTLFYTDLAGLIAHRGGSGLVAKATDGAQVAVRDGR